MKISRIGFGAISAGMLVSALGCSPQTTKTFESIKDTNVLAQLKSFVIQKELQANAATNAMRPEFKTFFAAARRGDWLTMSNKFWELAWQNGYCEGAGNPDYGLRGIPWESAREIWGAFEGFLEGDEKYAGAYAREIMESIPSGSIYFGGTDPGRFLVTGMQKSHVNADPFFTLTQNALSDETYLDYLRSMYGSKIYVPSKDDSLKCFQSYLIDAQKRLQSNQLRPGEDVKIVGGRLQAGGLVVMVEINALLATNIFDKNKDRNFYVEESQSIGWMYPYLEPHGLIMKINRQPLAELSDEVVQRDRDYWTKLVTPMIGNWLDETTSVKTVAGFVEKAFLRHEFNGFQGDRRFLLNKYSQRIFSKERSGIGGLYSWRLGIPSNGRETPAEYLPKSETERQRMIQATDFAYLQSWALCPDSQEAVYRYVAFLTNQNRYEDATIVVDTAVKFPLDPQTKAPFQDLATRLHGYRKAK